MSGMRSRHEMSDMRSRHEMSDMRSRHEMSDMRWVTKWWDMSSVTWDELHVMKHVSNWLWPYTFCEFPFLNPLVNPLLNPFLIPWGQAEWHNDETWDKWHEIETEMSERQPQTLFLSFWAEGRCGVGISYCGGGGVLRRGWAEVNGNIMRWLEGRGNG